MYIAVCMPWQMFIAIAKRCVTDGYGVTVGNEFLTENDLMLTALNQQNLCEYVKFAKKLVNLAKKWFSHSKDSSVHTIAMKLIVFYEEALSQNNAEEMSLNERGNILQKSHEIVIVYCGRLSIMHAFSILKSCDENLHRKIKMKQCALHTFIFKNRILNNFK